MTDLRQALRDTVAGPLHDDLDPRAVLAEARRRKARRQRWQVGGVIAATASVVLAVLVGQALVGGGGTPEPAPPPVEHVDALLLEAASPFPSRPTLTHHDPTPSNPDMYGLDTDRLVGVTPDGLAVRIRNVYRGDSTTFALVDPRTGATDWLPDHGYDLGEPIALSLESDRLVFIDNRDLTSDILVFDRITGSWTRHEIQGVRVGSQRMYPQEATMTVAPDGRLWFVAYPAPSQTHPTCPEGVDADPGCWTQWWSVPFPDGGQAQREPDADRKWLVWSGDTLATSSTDGLTISTDGEDTTVAWGAPEGCDVPGGDLPAVHSADPLVITVACADDTSAVTVYGDTYDPLYSIPVPGSFMVTAVGQEFLGLTRYANGTAHGSAYLLDIADRQLYEVTGAGRTVITGIAGDLVLWQDPDAGWIAQRGTDYWVAPLP